MRRYCAAAQAVNRSVNGSTFSTQNSVSSSSALEIVGRGRQIAQQVRIDLLGGANVGDAVGDRLGQLL